MATRVSPSGSYRFDRRLPPPIGRLAVATGARTTRAHENAVRCLLRLAERGRLDVLQAVKEGKLSVPQVLDADRTDQLDALVASLTPAPETLPLWASFDAWLGPVEGRSPAYRRWQLCVNKLKRLEVLPEDAVVSALAAVDWRTLGKTWPGSAADWNQCRRGVSRFLTVHLGDVYHPFRRAIMRAWPPQHEVERVPDLDLPTFWRVVEAAPEHVRPAFVTLLALGLRVGEYLRLRETDLHPITQTVSVPGTKTAGSRAVLAVDPELWPWIVAGVPAPVQYKWLREYWKRALAAAGADVTLRLHDLRHLPAQSLVSAGQSEASVQSFMRHASPGMTRRYAKVRDRGENARKLARLVLDARPA